MKLREAQKLRKTMSEDWVLISIEEFEKFSKEFRKDQATVEYLKNKIGEQAHKKTIEKILNELYCTPKEQVESKIKEIAKQFGVEIKE